MSEDEKHADSDHPGHDSSSGQVGHGGNGTAQHSAHAAHDDHGLAHLMSVPYLVGVFGALMILTVLTVSVTSIDLGGQGNFVVAMVIATIKAGLVIAFFMHLAWDSKFHLLLFSVSVLFLILFLGLALNDRSEYQPDIDARSRANAPVGG